MDTNEIISSMIDKIASGDNNEAQNDFQSLISQKMDAALDAKKVEVAQSIYSGKDVEDTIETEIDDNAEETTDEPSV